jgi:hypothetical protein
LIPSIEPMGGLVATRIGHGGLCHRPIRHHIVERIDAPIRRGLGDDGGIRRTGRATAGAAVRIGRRSLDS